MVYIVCLPKPNTQRTEAGVIIVYDSPSSQVYSAVALVFVVAVSACLVMSIFNIPSNLNVMLVIFGGLIVAHLWALSSEDINQVGFINETALVVSAFASGLAVFMATSTSWSWPSLFWVVVALVYWLAIAHQLFKVQDDERRLHERCLIVMLADKILRQRDEQGEADDAETEMDIESAQSQLCHDDRGWQHAISYPMSAIMVATSWAAFWAANLQPWSRWAGITIVILTVVAAIILEHVYTDEDDYDYHHLWR